MESKTLNLLEAMQLAQIVSKYFDTESIKGMTVNDFAYEVFGRLEVPEIAQISKLLIKNLQPEKTELVMLLCIEGMIKNNLLKLLDAYASIGFNP